MKPREYCCCAIPLVNAGIYATLMEQLALGIIVGTLAVGTPFSSSPLPFTPALLLIPHSQLLGPLLQQWHPGY